MKYFILLSSLLLLLWGCKLEEPKEFERYNCQLPTSIVATKDPENGKRFSFALSQPTSDVATLQWTIKSTNGAVVNTSSLGTYTVTLANEGKYVVQAELKSKCGQTSTLNADFEAVTVCNLTNFELFYRQKDGYEETLTVTLKYNALNEVIKRDDILQQNGKITSTSSSQYEKTEANLGSLTKPYILRKYADGSFGGEFYCDLQKRIVKRVEYGRTTTYTYGSDGFLEQEITVYGSEQVEYRNSYKYTATGLTITSSSFDKLTNKSEIRGVKVSLYSDKVKLPKYEINYGYSRGNVPPKYFKSEEYTIYQNGKVGNVIKTDFIIVLDNNNQLISEKEITDYYSDERRKIVYDCK